MMLASSASVLTRNLLGPGLTSEAFSLQRQLRLSTGAGNYATISATQATEIALDPQLISAIIAAVVAVLASAGTIAVASRNRESEEARHEKDHRRRLTERLLTLRLAAYPTVFSITQDLSRSSLFGEPKSTPEAIAKLRSKLKDWERDHGGFLMTEGSLKRFRSLTNALEGASTNPTDERLQKVWEAKNRLRGSLRADLSLLYEEDAKATSE